MLLLKITVLAWLCFFTTAEPISNCTTPDKQPGECTPIKQCPGLFSLLENLTSEKVSHLRSSRCGTDFDRTNPKVCCPSKAPVFPPNDNSTADISSPFLPKKFDCGTFAEEKIVRGEIALLWYYPWTVLLKYQKANKFQFHCGGTLINDRYVLTAAHCISKDYLPKNTTLVSVRLGEHNLDEDTDCETFVNEKICAEPFVELPVEEIIVHEGYSKRKSSLIAENDIALVRLSTKVTFTEFIQPACLPTQVEDVKKQYRGISLQRAGWDVDSHNVTNSQKIVNRVLGQNPDECNKMFNLTLTENNFCGIIAPHYKNCSSDSGGAITISHYGYSHYVAGVEAWHDTCKKEQVAVYTRIGGFMKWIVDNLKE